MTMMRTLRMQDNQWLSPREASWHLGVTVTTLAQWARAGRLPAAYTPGGHRRYRLADVQTLQAEREQKVPEPKKWKSDAVRLYEQGWSIRQVAQRFECGYGAMRRILTKHTVLRSRSAAEARDSRASAKTHTPADSGRKP
jgi:excisionase family DNA binding protein